MESIRYENITPEVATRYLSKNIKNNRNISERTVSKYARDMENGNWVTTHQGIAFSENGCLVDGQHTLSAIIKSGKTIRLAVARGLQNDSITSIDTGHTRNMTNLFVINCQERSYRDTGVRAVVKTLEYMFCGISDKSSVMSYSEMKEMLERNHGIAQLVYSLRQKVNTTKGLYISASLYFVAFIAALANDVKITDIDCFIGCIAFNHIDKDKKYNYEAALDFRDLYRSIKSGNKLIDNRDRINPESYIYVIAKEAIFKFVNDRKTVPSKVEIYPLTKEMIELFNQDIIANPTKYGLEEK